MKALMVFLGFLLVKSAYGVSPYSISPNLVVTGPSGSNNLGVTVGRAGDANGDGSPDFWAADCQANCTVRIYSALDGSQISSFQVPGTQIEFERPSLVLIGDRDGDGKDDLAYFSVAQFQIKIVSGFTGQLIGQIDPQAGYNFSWLTKLSSAGDLNQDGLQDLLVSSSGPGFADSVQVISGFDGTHLWEYQAGSLFSRVFPGEKALARVGDLSGDGIRDYLVSVEPSVVTPTQIRAIDGITGALLYTVQGQYPGQKFGHQAYDIGDTNGDGKSEWVISAPVEYTVHPSENPVIQKYDGATGALLDEIAYLPSISGYPTEFAFQIDASSDFNGDGINDLVYGTKSANQVYVTQNYSGLIRLVSGQDFSTIRDYWYSPTEAINPSDPSFYGRSLALIGDLDGDGEDEIVAGASGLNQLLVHTSMPNATNFNFRTAYSCAIPGQTTRPMLQASDLVISATSLEFTVSGVPAHSNILLYYSPGTSAAIDLGNFCLWFIDPAVNLLLGSGVADTQGNWQLNLSNPLTSAEMGAQGTLQALVITPSMEVYATQPVLSTIGQAFYLGSGE